MTQSKPETPLATFEEVDFQHLGFGKYMSDHMFTSHYDNEQWSAGSLQPYGPVSLMPTALALHYGQTVFEGMKAFRMNDKNISVFRIRKHYERLSRSLERMCMPLVPYSLFEEGIISLLEADQRWVPDGEHDSYYLRPLVFASEERYGVKISDEYVFIIMGGPVGPFYSKPLHVKVEQHYIRAAHGGTGAAKCAGNYGGAFYATRLARQEGFDQVLWTDASDELNIEESGTMNVFFRIGDTLVTPPLSDTILDGVTRDSICTVARAKGITVEERRISADELAAKAGAGELLEAFGAGTAAVTARIASISIRGKVFSLTEDIENRWCDSLQQELTDIRKGTSPDMHHWNTIVKATS